MMLSTLSVLLALSAPQVPQTTKTTNETQTTMALSDPPISEEDQDAWNRDLVLLLEIICVILNCNENSEPPVVWNGPTIMVQHWVTTYQLGGVNQSMTPEQLVEARARLHAMDILAANDPGFLPESLRADFRDSIANILQEIGE